MPAIPENSSAAQQLAYLRLGHLQAVVLDYDIPSAQMTRKVLSTIGVTQTLLTRDSREAFTWIGEKPVDLLIAARESRPEGGLELTRRLRSPDSPNRTLPILLTITDNLSDSVREGIDAGVNEIISKPFNVRVMLDRLTAIIDQPRAFILAPNYIGPDRRRESQRVPPAGVAERRTAPPPLVVGREALGEVFADSKPRLLKPDYALKSRLEAAATRMAGLEHILPQAEAARMGEDFLQWMLLDMDAVRQAYRLLSSGPTDPRTGIENMCKATMALRTHALPSGYALAARVAIALHDFTQRYYDVARPQHNVVLSKHVESLQAILANRLTGEDNPVARELVGELQLLVKRSI